MFCQFLYVGLFQCIAVVSHLFLLQKYLEERAAEIERKGKKHRDRQRQSQMKYNTFVTVLFFMLNINKDFSSFLSRNIQSFILLVLVM